MHTASKPFKLINIVSVVYTDTLFILSINYALLTYKYAYRFVHTYSKYYTM